MEAGGGAATIGQAPSADYTADLRLGSLARSRAPAIRFHFHALLRKPEINRAPDLFGRQNPVTFLHLAERVELRAVDEHVVAGALWRHRAKHTHVGVSQSTPVVVIAAASSLTSLFALRFHSHAAGVSCID
jgi:hypothetical protein